MLTETIVFIHPNDFKKILSDDPNDFRKILFVRRRRSLSSRNGLLDTSIPKIFEGMDVQVVDSVDYRQTAMVPEELHIGLTPYLPSPEELLEKGKSQVREASVRRFMAKAIPKLRSRFWTSKSLHKGDER